MSPVTPSTRISIQTFSVRCPPLDLAAGARLTLGHVRVDGKSNEITAMPALLDVEGMTVTADAMHTQRATAEAVTARGGTHAMRRVAVLHRSRGRIM